MARLHDDFDSFAPWVLSTHQATTDSCQHASLLTAKNNSGNASGTFCASCTTELNGGAASQQRMHRLYPPSAMHACCNDRRFWSFTADYWDLKYRQLKCPLLTLFVLPYHISASAVFKWRSQHTQRLCAPAEWSCAVFCFQLCTSFSVQYWGNCELSLVSLAQQLNIKIWLSRAGIGFAVWDAGDVQTSCEFSLSLTLKVAVHS